MTADLTAALERIDALAAAATKGATLDRYDHGGGRLARLDGPRADRAAEQHTRDTGHATCTETRPTKEQR